MRRGLGQAHDGVLLGCGIGAGGVRDAIEPGNRGEVQQCGAAASFQHLLNLELHAKIEPQHVRLEHGLKQRGIGVADSLGFIRDPRVVHGEVEATVAVAHREFDLTTNAGFVVHVSYDEGRLAAVGFGFQPPSFGPMRFAATADDNLDTLARASIIAVDLPMPDAPPEMSATF